MNFHSNVTMTIKLDQDDEENNEKGVSNRWIFQCFVTVLSILALCVVFAPSNDRFRLSSFENVKTTKSSNNLRLETCSKTIKLQDNATLPKMYQNAYKDIGFISKQDDLKRVCGTVRDDAACALKLLRDGIARRNYTENLISTSSFPSNCDTILRKSIDSRIEFSGDPRDVILCVYVSEDAKRDPDSIHEIGEHLYMAFTLQNSNNRPLHSWILYLSVFDWTGEIFGALIHGTLTSLISEMNLTSFESGFETLHATVLSELPLLSDVFVLFNFAHGIGHGLGKSVFLEKISGDLALRLSRTLRSPLPEVAHDDLFEYMVSTGFVHQMRNKGQRTTGFEVDVPMFRAMFWVYEKFFSDGFDVNDFQCELLNDCTCSWAIGWLESTTKRHGIVADTKIQDPYCFTVGLALRSTLMTRFLRVSYREGDGRVICDERFGKEEEGNVLRDTCLLVVSDVENGTTVCTQHIYDERQHVTTTKSG